MRQHVLNYEQTGRLAPSGRKVMDGIELPSRQPNKIMQRSKTPPPNRGSSTVTRGREDPPHKAAAATQERRPLPLDEVAKKHAELTRKGTNEKDQEPTTTYKNRAPAADESTVEKIFERLLDTTINASVRELLASSADMRRLVQKYTSNKRVAMSEVNIIDTDDMESLDGTQDVFNIAAYEHTLQRTNSGEFSAHDSVPLASIPAKFDDFKLDAIIDTGATICCVSENIWRQIGSPVYTERATKMRDANGNVAGTLGAMADFPVTIGGLTFFLTIHVVPNAPFDCILGTPFCAIASVEMTWRPSAELAVRLTDPNNDNKTVLIPAVVKGSRRRVLTHDRDF